MLDARLTDLVDHISERIREDQDPVRRAELGQYLTPAPVARFMAGLLSGHGTSCRILDPCAGTGVLVAAAIEALCGLRQRPEELAVVAYEIDELLIPHLEDALALCEEYCHGAGVRATFELRNDDFIRAASRTASDQLELVDSEDQPFDLVILNPPYRKISSTSVHRALLSAAGLEVSNLYAGFLGLALAVLRERGELVAITPRSFCNGTYFRSFRSHLLGRAAFSHLHVFDSRREAFQEHAVLQENIIFRLVKHEVSSVTISTGNGSRETVATQRTVPAETVVWPGDPEAYIRIVATEEGELISAIMRDLPKGLKSLGLDVSTGRLVDFRVRDALRDEPSSETVPLVYPEHLSKGVVDWPGTGRKPKAVAVTKGVEQALVPNADYVLVKRFSAKEERRRVVAAVYVASLVEAPRGVAFENHLNYVHRAGEGIDLELARGLAMFLNSTLVDQFFRQFSGHTQVNATDLRGLRFPTERSLREMGALSDGNTQDQPGIDRIVESVLGISIDWGGLHVAA